MEAPGSVGSPKVGLSGRETVPDRMTAGGDDGHAIGATAGPAEDLPELQPCDASFDRCPCRRQGPVDRLLGHGEIPVREPSDRCGHPGAGPDIGAVGEDGDALAFADPDDAVGAGGGQVVGAAGQGG